MSNKLYRIYLVTNSINLKKYVGYTSLTLDRRRYYHIRDTKRKKSIRRSFFHEAIRKYGIENFVWDTIFASEDESITQNIMETLMIMRYKSHCTEGGYNLTWGGDKGPENTGRKHTEEARRKISEKKKGMKREPFSEEYRKKMGKAQLGRKHSEETKAKLRKAHENRWTEEAREQQRQIALRDNSISSLVKYREENGGSMKGRHHTEEAKRKMSIIRKGKRLSEEHKMKIKLNNGMLGRRHTEESKLKMSLAKKKSIQLEVRPDTPVEGVPKTEPSAPMP